MHIWVTSGSVFGIPMHQIVGLYTPGNAEFTTKTFAMPGLGKQSGLVWTLYLFSVVDADLICRGLDVTLLGARWQRFSGRERCCGVARRKPRWRLRRRCTSVFDGS